MASVRFQRSGCDATPRQYLSIADAYLGSGVLDSVRNRAYPGRGYLPGHIVLAEGFSQTGLGRWASNRRI